jgi:protein-tyrosine-phosphatase/DNA-binding transcriptional ArsR family regulator
VSGTPAPPRFLRLAGHPLRWRLLSELARSDRRVGELCELAGQRQSLVSYHLRQLREGGLVTARRSAADGRDSYYVLDLARCRELLAHAGGALHPALAASRRPEAVPQARVLFLCTGNSSRSQMAEALLRDRSAGRVRAFSAGIRPKPVHPDAVAAMAARGLDLSAARSKHLDEFAGERFDRVVTLCDRVREACPELPGAVHWSVPDPAADPDGRPAFDRVADDLAERIEFLQYALEAS